MFCFHGGHRFLKRLMPHPFIGTNSYRNTSIQSLHSLQKHKPSRPIQPFKPKFRKGVKSAKKYDTDPTIYMRDTIRNIYNILKYSSWDSAQEQLSKLSIKWDSYTINQVLKTHPPMEKAWLFFNWVSKLKGFKHDQFTYTTMVDIFGEAGRISSMNYVFSQMKEKGIEIDAVTYTSLMHWLSNSGDFDGAMKIWEEMKDKGCCPTGVSYTAFMKVLFDNNREKEAINVYKEMVQSGLSPTCYTYTILMEYLIGSGKYKEALEIFRKMQEAGVIPDKAACNILIKKCCEAGETQTMTHILEYMKENQLVLRYPVFLEARQTLTTSGKSDALLWQVNPHILPELISNDVNIEFKRNENIFPLTVHEGLVTALLGKEKLIAVDHLLIGMMDKNIKLNSAIISTIVKVNSDHRRPNGALLAFKYCLRMGIIIHRNTYLDLVGVLIRSDLFPKVLEIVQEMSKSGNSLGIYHAAVLMYRLGKAGRPLCASKIFNRLPDHQKCSATYTAMISAYFSAGSSEKALKIYHTMRKKGFAPTLGTYNVLLSGLLKSKRVSEAEIYRKEKKSIEIEGYSQDTTLLEDKICDLIFGGDFAS